MQISALGGGKTQERIGRSKLKKFLGDIISKNITKEKDIIDKFKPSVDEYNETVDYKTTREKTQQKNYMDYVKKAKELIFEGKDIPELKLNEPSESKDKQKTEEPSGSKDKQYSSDSSDS